MKGLLLMEIISSLKNPKVLSWKALKDKKGREAQNAFLVEGVRMVQEALSSSFLVRAILLRDDFVPDFPFPDSVPGFAHRYASFPCFCGKKKPLTGSGFLIRNQKDSS